MPETVTMPQLGESVTEGTIARWLKQPGEHVERHEAIAEVVTDKVNAEIPAPSEGVLTEHLVPEGSVVAVGAPICVIAAAGEAGAPAPAAAAPAAARAGGEPAPAAPAQEARGGSAAAASAASAASAAASSSPPQAVANDGHEAGAGAPDNQAGSTSSANGQDGEQAVDAPAAGLENGHGAETMHVTPAVRMLVREHAIDLAAVQGTGIGGRVTKKDVLSYVQQQHVEAGRAPAPAADGAPPAPTGAEVSSTDAPPAAAPAARAGGAAPVDGTQLSGDTLVPLTPARRSIADHMVRSRQTSPHAWTMVEVDMTAVARLRAANRAQFRSTAGADLTFLPFVARAVTSALRRWPSLNASWSADGIVVRRDINLGIAVALDDNLIVPVLRGADALNLVGLARGLADLTDRARAGRLRIDDLTGGSFTLNNAGALGTVLSQAIINQPQAAICVMDSIVKRPVVVGDAIAIRSMMNLSLSFDHRINDGLQATRFLIDVKRQLEGIDEAAPLL